MSTQTAVESRAQAGTGRSLETAIHEASAVHGAGDFARAVELWSAILDEFAARAPKGVYARLFSAYRRMGKSDTVIAMADTLPSEVVSDVGVAQEVVKAFKDVGDTNGARKFAFEAARGASSIEAKRKLLLIVTELDAQLSQVPRALRTLNSIIDSYDNEPSDRDLLEVSGLVSRRVDRMVSSDAWEDYWRVRKKFVYLHVCRRLIEIVSRSADTVADIGSNKSPLLDFYGDIPHKYSVDISAPYVAPDVIAVTEDFHTWTPPRPIQVATCLQVMEHVSEPEKFARRMLEIAEVCIVSVPHLEPAGLNPGHIQNDLTLDDMVRWFGREPNYHYIAKELSGDERIICLFDTATDEKYDSLHEQGAVAQRFRHRWSMDEIRLRPEA